MGRTNRAGGTDTLLQTSTSGSAYRVVQAGAGVALHGESAAGHGGLLATAKPGKHGLLARNTSATPGAGAAVRAEGGTNTAVQARTSGASRYAVDGRNAAVAGGAIGIYGESNSLDGVGVRGQNNAGGAGVHGNADDGVGVRGSSVNAPGVQGFSNVHAGVQGTSIDHDGVEGTSTNAYGVYARSSNSYACYLDGSTFAGGYLDVSKISAPAAPEPDAARLFVRDNGSAKLQLCVLFPTGAAQVIATEP
jgi:hypothetical protein